MIVSVLFLIGLFSAISSYLIILGLSFIGLSYLIVYIGAVILCIKKIKFAALVWIQLYKKMLFILTRLWITYNLEGNNSSILFPVKNKSKDNILSYSLLNRNLFKFKQKSRFYSTNTNQDSLNDVEFYEWLCGFIDGEGSFRIRKDFRRSKSPFVFEFAINLHIDDKDVFNYIKTRLNLGKVNSYEKLCRFTVYSKAEIRQIIDILSKYPLKTTKRLDFEDWKKAFELYYNDKNTNDSKENIIPIIDKLREGMNKGRPYEISKLDDIKITKHWLLGFIEGEGSFFIVKEGFATTFTLGQISREKPLLEKIVEFFKSYNEKFYIKESSLSIYDKAKDDGINQNPYSEIQISNLDFLRKVLVPLLSDLNWHTKKYKDFKDWIAILDLKAAGLHTTPKGKEIIHKIHSQMNNNRLSTNSPDVNIDTVQLHNEVKNLLTQSTNHLNKGKSVD